jgi:FMN-dependent NADH-azoreductase
MGRLLYIQASPRGARSVSTAVADAFAAAYRKARPADDVRTLNLFAADLLPFGGFALNAKYAILNGLSFSTEEQEAWGRVATLAEEFKSFDRYAVAARMWNVSIAYRLQHSLDLLIQPTLTFSFTPEQDYRGLVTGKPLFPALARGGEYPAGSPGEARDFQMKYLKTILGFIGFTDIRMVVAEPTPGAPETTAKRRDDAIVQAARMGAQF